MPREVPSPGHSEKPQSASGARKPSYVKVPTFGNPPVSNNNAPKVSMTPKLKCFELLAIRQKNKAEKKAKKAQNIGEDDTRLDTTVTILDIDDIDPIHGTFKMKFKVHAIYKFDDQKLKSTVSILSSI